MVNETEGQIQKRIIKNFKMMGFTVFKMHLLFTTGVPDLLFVLPDGRVFWMEIKQPGRKTTKKQEWFHGKLRLLGHSVCTVVSYYEALAVIKSFMDCEGIDYGESFKKECGAVLTAQ